MASPVPKITIAPDDSPQPSEFLFRNRRFMSIDRAPSNSSSCYNSDESDHSVDWDSFSEDEQPDDKPQGKTYLIAKELLTTERTFVQGLTLLNKEFRETVLSANRAHDKPVLPADTLKAILSNVGSLYVLNSGLLNQLEERLAKWNSIPKIGDIMLNTAPFFKMYSQYISNFDNALKVLEESCKKNVLFNDLVKEFERSPICANLPLSGYLLETIQRIPRYKLLLQDYLKHLPADSDDRHDSEKALELISKVAAHVNESIRQVDNFRKLIEVQKKLVGDTGDNLISPSRKLLLEGELLKYSRKEVHPRMFFLFTDLLIYAYAIPPANTTYKVIKRIPLRGMKVIDLDDPEVKHGLQIISTSKSFRLGTSTEETKIQWMKALSDALNEYEASIMSRELFKVSSKLPSIDETDIGATSKSDEEPLGSLAPPWLPDSCVSMCMMCTMRFTMTRRRHHCRACGNIFCGSCSAYEVALKYQDYKMDRVCQTCYDKLTGEQNNTTLNGNNKDISGRRTRQTVKRTVRRTTVKLKPAVLEVKARERNCDISGYLFVKTTKWRKRWLEIAEFVLYIFEKHEDVSCKKTISLPGYSVIFPVPDTKDNLKLCLTHPGTGSIYFKAESEDITMKWVKVFQNAVKLKLTDDTD
ncbi:FYVE, RhoGEF and PH domain-containing protein 6-like [Dysidea avara]|uniref:FYVE, RhoGEF and PH domain-containing protein 6-like n=1 Tax=Dysidea avara TaxID=196820 RepID=UPI003320FD2C